jgi:hypothetical protein
MARFGWIEVLVILIFGVLLVVGISWIVRRGRERKTPQPERPQATRLAAERTPTESTATQPRLASPFADVERQVKVLRRQVTDGLLTEDECKTRMRDLMVEDAAGNWWMVGYETGEWYRHDGNDWVRADPPIAHGG